MALTFNTKPKSDFQIPPAGAHLARLYRIVDLGTQETTFKGEKKWVPQVLLTFELIFEKMEDGKPLIISSTYTMSLGEKSKMRQIVRSLTGTALTDETASGFNLSELIGKVATVTVIHKTGRDGRDRAYIQDVGAVPKGTKIEDGPFNKPMVFDLGAFDQAQYDSLPQYYKDKIASSPEYLKIVDPQGKGSIVTTDDIPF